MTKLMSILISLFLMVPAAFAVQDSIYMKQQLVVTVTTGSTKEMDENLLRKYLLIQNNGTTNVIVKLASTQSGSEGVVIVPGGNWEPSKAPTSALYMKSASSTDSVLIIEGQ